MQTSQDRDPLWSGEQGSGGISWADRSRMGLLRGVIDAADSTGRRNAYMHTLHLGAVNRELARAGPFDSALDFGCGTGRFIPTLSSYARHVVAADKEPAMVEAAGLHAGRHGATIVCCGLTSLPFDSASFDLSFSSSVLCVTVRDALQDIVRELARVTRPGGTLLLLEQVSADLPLSRYGDILSNAGFTMLRAYPIRSSTSFVTRLAARQRWIPLSLLSRLCSVELFLTDRAARRPRVGYTEFALVARR